MGPTESKEDKIINDTITTSWVRMEFPHEYDREKFVSLCLRYPEFSLNSWYNRSRSIKRMNATNVDGSPFTLKNFVSMWTSQNGLCPICPNDRVYEMEPMQMSPYKRTFTCVDHNHNTMVVRALVCPLCNSLLGFARDSTARLAREIDYLQRYGNYEESC